MSDAAVRAALRQLEAWLEDGSTPLDGALLEVWNRDFNTALASAERGPGWAETLAQARRLGQQVEARRHELEGRRDAIRQELQQQLQGARALKGYGSHTR